jgi:ARG/rhodanese/phosphatase superfamily protein
MRIWTFAPLLFAAVSAFGFGARPAAADQGMRISGPHVHDNLAVYFVHGVSAGGAIPLTLQEALAKGSVQVVETGQVNELQIENTGDEEVFIQAGDIVKGGKQDRVLTVSFVLPSKSGRVPIASFCVEQGRWSARGKEDQFKFSSAHEAMPSRSALLAMVTPSEPVKTAEPVQDNATGRQQQRVVRTQRGGDDVAEKQRKVWDSVASTQGKLSTGLNAELYAPQSATSLQLTLEHEKLKEARAAFATALEAAGLRDGDVVGYVVAINGKMSSANLYPSNGLFRKMWSKQLAATVTEAIGEKREAVAPEAPKSDVAIEFLAEAERGAKQERAVAAGARIETRDAVGALYNEARRADGKWVHRNYLAK